MANEPEKQAQFPLPSEYKVDLLDAEGKVIGTDIIMRDELTFKERTLVIEQLRREGKTAFLHAATLTHETDVLIAAGKLSTEDEA